MSADLRYIVVEGPIGVGKTSLARRLAQSFESALLLEDSAANPFLERYYRNPRQGALPTQLFFLFQRAHQVQALRQEDLFGSVRVADFLMEKDRLFAELTLDEDELGLYDQVHAQLDVQAPTPDLVIYLQAPVEVLLRRIARRGNPAEQLIESSYLQRLVDAYTRFFHEYTAAPLLIVNAAVIDPAHNDEDYGLLLQQIRAPLGRRHYFNPVPFEV
jgi:deoxyguanosine kinase